MARSLMKVEAIRPSDADRGGDFARLRLDEQARVDAWCAALEALPTWGLPIAAALQRLAVQMGVSEGTARRLYYGAANGRTVVRDGRPYFVRGWRALVDWRTARGKESELPPATIVWMQQIFEQHKGRAHAMRRAYDAVCSVWRLRVHPIPGYEHCGGFPPSGPKGLPLGWGYRTFCSLMPSSDVKAAARQGLSAASRYLPTLRTTRVGLRPGEVVMIDDVWHDMLVKTTLSAPPMRLFELCMMDLLSGCKFLYGLKPEFREDEGSRRRLQERDMRFLVAAYVTQHGYRRDTGTLLIGERGTSVIRQDLENVLADVTGRKITFQAGVLKERPALPDWWTCRNRGTPGIKAALESSFNLMHNAMAMLPGQTGPLERETAPDELHGRKQADVALVKALAGLELPERIKAQIQFPFYLLPQASELIGHVYAHLNARTEHDLEGWEQLGLVLGEVRPDPRLPNWVPVDAYGPEAPESAALAALARLPGCFRLRRMSPAEVWTRESHALTRLGPSILPQILGKDLAVERTLARHGRWEFEDRQISPDPIIYSGLAVNVDGHEVLLRRDETYLTFVNPFDPRLLVVCDARGAYIGACRRIEPVCRTDLVALHQAMGAAAREQLGRLADYRARHQGEVWAKAEAATANAQLLGQGQALPAPASKAALRAFRDAADELLDGDGGVDEREPVAAGEVLDAAELL